MQENEAELWKSVVEAEVRGEFGFKPRQTITDVVLEDVSIEEQSRSEGSSLCLCRSIESQ